MAMSTTSTSVHTPNPPNENSFPIPSYNAMTQMGNSKTLVTMVTTFIETHSARFASIDTGRCSNGSFRAGRIPRSVETRHCYSPIAPVSCRRPTKLIVDDVAELLAGTYHGVEASSCFTTCIGLLRLFNTI